MKWISQIADWWDVQHREAKEVYDQFVEDHPSWFSVVVVTGLETSMEITTGFMDMLRIGDGVAEGTLGGVAKDGLRLLGLLGPAGKLVRLGAELRGIQLARAIVDPGGPNCAWIAATKALQQTGQKTFVAVKDLARAAGINLADFAEGATARDVMAVMRRLGARFGPQMRVTSMEQVEKLVPHNGSVVMFGVDWTRGVQRLGHMMYAFRDVAGRVRIMDRSGVYTSLRAMESFYQGIENAVPAEAILISNVFGKIVGLERAGVLAMELLAYTHQEPEAVAQAFEVRKATARQLRSLPGTSRRHVVTSGESLWRIARHHYESPFKWPVIYEANRRTVRNNPNLLRVGTELIIPDLPRVGRLPRFH